MEKRYLTKFERWTYILGSFTVLPLLLLFIMTMMSIFVVIFPFICLYQGVTGIGFVSKDSDKSF